MYKYSQPIFDNGAKAFSTSDIGKTGHTQAKNNLYTDLTFFTTNNNMDPRLKCKTQTIKFLEANIEENLYDFGYGLAVLDTTPKT